MPLEHKKRSDYIQHRKQKGLPIYLKKLTTRHILLEEPEKEQTKL